MDIHKEPIRSPAASRVISDSGFEDLVLADGFLSDFAASPPISSYIYCLCAGQYTSIVNDDPKAPTPMRIFARQSKIDYLDHKEVFRTITEGIGFYKNLFSYDFPFAKYDVIYVPEFRIGAMENVGAVTFTDRILKPLDQSTDKMKLMHAYIHLHELAHMWFGDLTTMRWWNDLWLKESFADFCSVTCMSDTPSIRERYPDPELLFLNMTARGLFADLAPTTHPIQVPIKHTGDAVSSFDAISYDKGASWIKTMDSYVGRRIVQQGLAKYVKKYAFTNTTLDDLVTCLNESVQTNGTGREGDFAAWTDDWLKKSGVNTLKAHFENSKLSIKQGFSKHGDK